jgi:hypothetical protein
MTDAGYATIYNDETAGTLSSNVTVFTGKKNGSWLSLTEQANTIPARTAVVLKGAEGYFSFTPAASAPAITGENELLGTAAPLTATGSEYVLGKANETVGFYRAEEGSAIPEGKAYLEVTTASGGEAPEFYGFSDEDDATSINEELRVRQEESEGAVYNLAGQQIVNCKSSNRKLPRGIYIKNGRKVLK